MRFVSEIFRYKRLPGVADWRAERRNGAELNYFHLENPHSTPESRPAGSRPPPLEEPSSRRNGARPPSGKRPARRGGAADAAPPKNPVREEQRGMSSDSDGVGPQAEGTTTRNRSALRVNTNVNNEGGEGDGHDLTGKKGRVRFRSPRLGFLLGNKDDNDDWHDRKKDDNEAWYQQNKARVDAFSGSAKSGPLRKLAISNGMDKKLAKKMNRTQCAIFILQCQDKDQEAEDGPVVATAVPASPSPRDREISLLQQQISDLQISEMGRLKEDLGKSVRENENLVATVERCNMKIAEIASELDQANATVKNLQIENSALMEEKRNNAEELAQVKEERNNVQKRIENLTAHIDELTGKMAKLQSDADHGANLATQFSKLQKSHKVLKAKLKNERSLSSLTQGKKGPMRTEHLNAPRGSDAPGHNDGYVSDSGSESSDSGSESSDIGSESSDSGSESNEGSEGDDGRGTPNITLDTEGVGGNVPKLDLVGYAQCITTINGEKNWLKLYKRIPQQNRKFIVGKPRELSSLMAQFRKEKNRFQVLYHPCPGCRRMIPFSCKLVALYSHGEAIPTKENFTGELRDGGALFIDNKYSFLDQLKCTQNGIGGLNGDFGNTGAANAIRRIVKHDDCAFAKKFKKN